jgi:hypothetical protein
VLLVASHADERPFRADAPLLLDLLAEVYKVGTCCTYLKCVTLCFLNEGQCNAFGQGERRPFQADAPLLLDLLAEVYRVGTCI